MSKTNDQILDLFLSNYSARDIARKLLDRMTKEEIDQELESFEAIQNDPENSEHPIQ